MEILSNIEFETYSKGRVRLHPHILNFKSPEAQIYLELADSLKIVSPFFLGLDGMRERSQLAGEGTLMSGQADRSSIRIRRAIRILISVLPLTNRSDIIVYQSAFFFHVGRDNQLCKDKHAHTALQLKSSFALAGTP